VALAVIAGVACDRGTAARPTASEATPATPSDPPSVAPTLHDASGVSFRRDIVPVFEKTCTQADHCHGSVLAEDIDLDLRPAAAYGSLVERRAQARAGALRVKAGDSSASFLVTKIVGPLKHSEGKRMPLDPDTGAPAEPSPITREFVDHVLRAWIGAGAPNN
jgi:hypothetical protein